MNNKKTFAVILVFICTVLFTGCIFAPGGSQERKSETQVKNNLSPDAAETTRQLSKTEPAPDPVLEQVTSMSLDEKVGQVLVFGFEGYEAGDGVNRLIADYKPGGMIILGGNVKSTSQLLSLVNSIKQANTPNKIPLFISIDEEGGRISRMPSEFVKIPTCREIGKIDNQVFSYSVGSVMGQEIKAFGFNMDFAPVMDIDSNPRNPVIGDRSFGPEPDLVSRLGVQTMKGLQSVGIIPVVKHFPGHGDTSTDSHVGLPVLKHDLNRLQSFELIPFKDAVNGNADAVMVAHILLSEIDPDNPASLSKKIITGILRESMGFTGVVITDDMTMGAIIKNYDIGEAAVKSFNAGSDMILVCHGADNRRKVYEALEKAAMAGTIAEERLNQSVYRVLKLKSKYHITDIKTAKVDVESINSSINRALNTYQK